MHTTSEPRTLLRTLGAANLSPQQIARAVSAILGASPTVTAAARSNIPISTFWSMTGMLLSQPEG